MSHIEQNSYAPDPLRDTLHVVGPFRIIAGRGIIDSRGRVIAYLVAGETLDDNGNVRGWRAGRGDLSACCADDHAHAIAGMLNNPQAWAHQDATARIVSDPGNAEFWRRLAGSVRKAMTMI